MTTSMPMLPTAPLALYIRRLLALNTHLTVRTIAGGIAARLGTKVESEETWLYDLLSERFSAIQASKADKVAIALGTHPGDRELWGSLWWNPRRWHVGEPITVDGAWPELRDEDFELESDSEFD